MSSRLPAAERREQLLDVAMTVFADNGYHGASMNDVASQAGVTKPVLYQHFPSKRDLYLELLDGVSRRLADAITAAARGESSVRGQTEAALAAYFRFVEDSEREFRLLFGRGAPGEEEFGSGRRRVEDRMADTVGALLDERIDAESRQVFARAIIGMSEGVCRTWISNPARPSADSIAKQLADLMIGGLTGLAARAPTPG